MEAEFWAESAPGSPEPSEEGCTGFPPAPKPEGLCWMPAPVPGPEEESDPHDLVLLSKEDRAEVLASRTVQVRALRRAVKSLRPLLEGAQRDAWDWCAYAGRLEADVSRAKRRRGRIEWNLRQENKALRARITGLEKRLKEAEELAHLFCFRAQKADHLREITEKKLAKAKEALN